MRPSRVPLCVLAVSFLTFLLAFGAMLYLLKPQIEAKLKQRREDEQSVAESNANPVGGPRPPRPDRGNDARPNPAGTDTKSAVVVRGVVTDNRSRPMDGVAVHLFADEPEDSQDGIPNKHLAKVMTNQKGQFAHPVESGRIPRSVLFVSGDAPRVLKTGLMVTRSGTIAMGKVTMGTGGPLRVEVRDEEGRSIPAAQVSIVDPSKGNEEYLRVSYRGKTDALGVMQVHGADFGEYKVVVHHEGYSEYTSVHVGDEEGLMVAVTLAEASAYVDGVVLDTAGAPISAGSVIARPGDTARGGAEAYRGSVNEQGEFHVGPLPRGDYNLEVMVEGMAQSAPCFAQADGDRVRVRVEYAGTVKGTVSAAGAPPGSLELSVLRRDQRGAMQIFVSPYRKVLQQDRGTFQVAGLPPGDYQIRVAAPGLAAGRSEMVHVAPGEEPPPANVELTASGAAMEGIVFHARGYAVGNVRVTAYEGEAALQGGLRSMAGADSPLTYSSAEGAFAFEQLSPGMHVLVLEAAGLPSRTLGPVYVPANAKASFGTIVMGGGSSIAGRILDTNAQPLPYGRAVVCSEDGTSVNVPLSADRAGNYVLRGLSEGTYYVRSVNQAGVDGESMRLEVVGDQHLRADLTLAGE